MAEHSHLSRRERQIMDIVFRLGQATVSDVIGAMADAPTRTSVRTLMRILEDKGHLKHRKSGRAYVYQPTQARQRVGRSALRRVISTFFDGSLEQAVAAHLSDPGVKLTAEQRRRLADLIRQAREREASS